MRQRGTEGWQTADVLTSVCAAAQGVIACRSASSSLSNAQVTAALVTSASPMREWRRAATEPTETLGDRPAAEMRRRSSDTPRFTPQVEGGERKHWWQYGGGPRWTARLTCSRRGIALTSAYTAECAAEESVVDDRRWAQGILGISGKRVLQTLGGHRPSIRTTTGTGLPFRAMKRPSCPWSRPPSRSDGAGGVSHCLQCRRYDDAR